MKLEKLTFTEKQAKPFFIFPTFCLEDENKENKLSDGFLIYGFVASGLIFNAFSILGHIELFGRYGSSIGLAALGAHVVPNVVSGLYEWYRYEKNRLVEEINGDEQE